MTTWGDAIEKNVESTGTDTTYDDFGSCSYWNYVTETQF